MLYLQVPSQIIKKLAIRLLILETPDAKSTSTATAIQYPTLQAEFKGQNNFPLIPP